MLLRVRSTPPGGTGATSCATRGTLRDGNQNSRAISKDGGLLPLRTQSLDTEFAKERRMWSPDLAMLRQNWLLTESAFLSFARDRGLGVVGVIKGEPGELHRRGFLSADGRNGKDLQFHPFRFHALQQALNAGDRITTEKARQWNSTAELAILLEPLYWPEVVGHLRFQIGEMDHKIQSRPVQAQGHPATAPPGCERWAKIHEALRIDAAWIDPNRELYILLRLSLWAQREALRGRIAGALWLRHMAEVIRRGFEEVHAVRWPEEDRAFGRWTPGARARLFGSERPYDDPLRSKGFIAYQFGLFTGSTLRWYVEGETEYYAILHLLEQPAKLGIELVNLRGEISAEKRNAARKLEDALKEDLALRRFSVISFDRDLEPNVRAIRAQIVQGHVVGLIDANDPDFEFANFSLDELVEVAARMDDQFGLDGGKVRRANWQGIKSAQAFADHYSKISDRHSSPKGKVWGKALAAWALKHSAAPRSGAERPFLRMISAAFWAWHSNYEIREGPFRNRSADIRIQAAQPTLESAACAKIARQK